MSEKVTETKPKKAPVKKKPETMSNKKVKINIDFTIADVVELDSQGKGLEFDSSPGQFLALPDDIYRSLSRGNRLDYKFAKDEHDAYGSDIYSDEQNDDEWLQQLEAIDHTNLGKSTLEIKNKVPGMSYAWVRPDGLMDAGKKGYRYCKDKRVRTVYNPDGDKPNEIRRNGEVELILMETTKKNADAIRAAHVEKTNRLLEAGQNEAETVINQSGAKLHRD